MPIPGIIASQISGHLTPPDTGAMFPLGMVSVGSGGTSTITFSSIPNTYTHLQIRAIHAINSGGQSVNIRFNSDTGNNYAYHQLYGDGTSAYGDAGTTRSSGLISYSNQASGSSYSTFVADILDYKNTNKYKTIRSLTGTESNNTYTGYMKLMSSLWQSTSAITSISLFYDSQNFREYSSFALYGIL